MQNDPLVSSWLRESRRAAVIPLAPVIFYDVDHRSIHLGTKISRASCCVAEIRSKSKAYRKQLQVNNHIKR